MGLFEREAMVANGIAIKLNKAMQPGLVTQAAELLTRRIIEAGNSMYILSEHSPPGSIRDGAVILRGLYDATLQALYILSDAAKREERAKLYLDHFWIEKEKVFDIYIRSDTSLGRHVTSSPQRVAVEPAIRSKIQSVKKQFLTKKGKPRTNWYEGDLRSVAVAVGFESEYELFQKSFSGIVHSSSYALQEGMQMPWTILHDVAWRFSFRVLGRFAQYVGVVLDPIETEFVKASENNAFDGPLAV